MAERWPPSLLGAASKVRFVGSSGFRVGFGSCRTRSGPGKGTARPRLSERPFRALPGVRRLDAPTRRVAHPSGIPVPVVARDHSGVDLWSRWHAPSAPAPLAASLPRQSGAGFLPPHHLGGAHKRGAPYSSHRAPFRYSRRRGLRPRCGGQYRLSFSGCREGPCRSGASRPRPHATLGGEREEAEARHAETGASDRSRRNEVPSHPACG